MSLRDLIDADATNIVFGGDFGITVRRRPHGNAGASAAVSGLWLPDDPVRDASMDGERYQLEGELQVSESVCVANDDTWEINDEIYATLTTGEPEEGIRYLRLRRTDKVTTSRHRGDFR